MNWRTFGASGLVSKMVPARFTYRPTLSATSLLRYGERSHRLGLASHTHRPLDRFGAIAHFQLAIDAAQVVSNGLGTDPASGRDLACRLSLAYQGEDAAFGHGKPLVQAALDRFMAGEARQRQPRQRTSNGAMPGKHGLDSLHKLVG